MTIVPFIQGKVFSIHFFPCEVSIIVGSGREIETILLSEKQINELKEWFNEL